MITILTPTYNRKEYLINLYNSLQEQGNLNFEWLIVDDGSTDDTEMLIKSLINLAKFKIIYKYKLNGGKHTALNYGYKFINTKLTFIVDSDDILTRDAIDRILNVYDNYKNSKDICGFSFLRGKFDGGILSDREVPFDGHVESYVECRVNRGIGGDMAEVWFTDCLKEYPFPEFEGEKFLGEDVVWIKMSNDYKMVFFNSIIYLSDYLQGGLTTNRRIHNISSPKGCVYRAEVFLNSNAKLKYKIKAIMQYHIYGRIAKINNKNLFYNCNEKILYVLFTVPSLVIYFKWKKSYFKSS